MKVSCLRTDLTQAEADKAGIVRAAGGNKRLTTGKTYLVLGLDVVRNSPDRGSGIFIQIDDDGGRPSWAAIQLFDIQDPRASRYWQFGRLGEWGFTLQPAEFFAPDFHESLGDGEAGAVATYATVRQRLDDEHRIGTYS